MKTVWNPLHYISDWGWTCIVSVAGAAFAVMVLADVFLEMMKDMESDSEFRIAISNLGNANICIAVIHLSHESIKLLFCHCIPSALLATSSIFLKV